MFDHVDYKALAAWHREAAEKERSAGRMQSYHARMTQARQCAAEALKRENGQ